jgi:hypothetical protein
MSTERDDNATTGSVPAGNGGRVRIPIFRNREGGDASIDPDYSIYSGLRKRNARFSGKFCDVKGPVPPDFPED